MASRLTSSRSHRAVGADGALPLGTGTLRTVSAVGLKPAATRAKGPSSWAFWDDRPTKVGLALTVAAGFSLTATCARLGASVTKLGGRPLVVKGGRGCEGSGERFDH